MNWAEWKKQGKKIAAVALMGTAIVSGSAYAEEPMNLEPANTVSVIQAFDKNFYGDLHIKPVQEKQIFRKVMKVEQRLREASGVEMDVSLTNENTCAYAEPESKEITVNKQFAQVLSEDELAFVLAHETGHCTMKDEAFDNMRNLRDARNYVGDDFSENAEYFISNYLGKIEEEIADELAVGYMQKAGYNPEAGVSGIKKTHQFGAIDNYMTAYATDSLNYMYEEHHPLSARAAHIKECVDECRKDPEAYMKRIEQKAEEQRYFPALDKIQEMTGKSIEEGLDEKEVMNVVNTMTNRYLRTLNDELTKNDIGPLTFRKVAKVMSASEDKHNLVTYLALFDKDKEITELKADIRKGQANLGDKSSEEMLKILDKDQLITRERMGIIRSVEKNNRTGGFTLDEYVSAVKNLPNGEKLQSLLLYHAPVKDLYSVMKVVKESGDKPCYVVLDKKKESGNSLFVLPAVENKMVECYRMSRDNVNLNQPRQMTVNESKGFMSGKVYYVSGNSSLNDVVEEIYNYDKKQIMKEQKVDVKVELERTGAKTRSNERT